MSHTKMYCKHSKEKLTKLTFSNGTEHLERRCESCNKHLGFKAYKTADDSVLYFGKHKGKTYKEVSKEDPDYLHWLVAQDWCKPRMRALVEEAFEKCFQKLSETDRFKEWEEITKNQLSGNTGKLSKCGSRDKLTQSSSKKGEYENDKT